MKAGIITVQKAHNVGSFLQAFALSRTLEELGCDVSFLNLDKKEITNRTYRSYIQKRDIKKLFFSIRQLMKYRKSFRLLNTCKTSYFVSRENYDAVFIGSDELWNINNSDVASIPQYFGVDINSTKINSFAVSCANARLEEIQARYPFKESLERMNMIAVRDSNTRKLVQDGIGQDPELVMDPTFLYDFPSAKVRIPKADYILVYGYVFQEEEIRKIKSFAQKAKMPILSVSFYHTWCDKCIPAAPLEFLQYLKHAKYVVTNTFHGTVLSIQAHKNFAVFSENKDKVFDVLQSFSLVDRDVTGIEKLDKVFRSPIDYLSVQAEMKRRKEKSLTVLKNMLR